MKPTPFTEAVKELIEFDLSVMDEFVEEEIEQIADIGNPEKLLDKKYEEWTPQDLQMLGMVYGTQEPNTLSDFIFKQEYGKVLEMEKRNA